MREEKPENDLNLVLSKKKINPERQFAVSHRSIFDSSLNTKIFSMNDNYFDWRIIIKKRQRDENEIEFNVYAEHS